MKNIKQTLSEELNKMKYMLGYQRGMVISEQENKILNEATPPTEKQTEALNAGWGPVSDEYARKLPVDANGKIIPKANNQKLTIRQLIEKDIANEKLGITWAQVKERFGSSGQSGDNQLLWKAWKGGWRPGKEVPEQFQTPTYKSNNTRMASIDMKQIQPGAVVGATDGAQTQVAPSVQQNTEIKTPEDAKKAIADAEQKAQELKDQVKMDTEACRTVGKAINPINPLKKGVTSPVLCAKLWQCIEQGFIRRGDKSFIEACPKPAQQTPDASTTTPDASTTTPDASTTTPGASTTPGSLANPIQGRKTGG
jgi:hypothetical protein